MSSILDSLNPEQREAASHVNGPLLVFAGAGSGKTRTLTHRIAYLIGECGVPPGAILAVTFTNKAAGEMRERVEQLIGQKARGMWIGTFHSICARLLREHAPAIGRSHNFTICDEDDRLALLKRVLAELNVDATAFPPRQLAWRISDYKNELIDPERAAILAGDRPTPPVKVLLEVYRRYQALLRANDAMDFDDLIMAAVVLLRENEEVRHRLQQRFAYVLVDEYQDINRAQYEWVRILTAEHRNLCVVGDDDQSIYGWRGARVEIILEFEDDFPDAKVVKLERNYRSTGAVLAVANAVIANNTGRRAKKLRPQGAAGEPVVLHVAGNEQDEAWYVADMIEHSVRHEHRSHGDHAVLYRTNSQSRIFEQVFASRRLPYTIIGGTRFYDRREVRDIIAYLRVIQNPADEVALVRILNVPARGIGDKTVAMLRDRARAENLPLSQVLAIAAVDHGFLPTRARVAVEGFCELLTGLRAKAAEMPAHQLIQAVVDDTGYAEALRQEGGIEASSRLENIDELLTVATETVELLGRGDLAAFLEHVSLVSDVDDLNSSADKVVLMTLHSAKGLEFDVVFMVGLEEGLFPHERSAGNHQQIEEERRLCYVGMTRARQRLYLTRAWRRTLRGNTMMPEPSRFVGEVPAELLSGAGLLPQTGTTPAASIPVAGRLDYGQSISRARRARLADGAPLTPTTLTLPAAAKAPYKAGDKVRHPSFGDGIVVSCDQQTVQVAFPDQGVKSLAIEYANLERR